MLLGSDTVDLAAVDLDFNWDFRPVMPVMQRYCLFNSMGRAEVHQDKHGLWIAMANDVRLMNFDGSHFFPSEQKAKNAAEECLILQAASVLRRAAALVARIDEQT